MNSSTILVHPRLIAAITAVLRFHGFKKDGLPDGIAEVQTRTLEWARSNPLPTEIDSGCKLVTTIAINWCIDEDRKKDVRKDFESKHHVGLCSDPDMHGPLEEDPDREDPVDLQRKLEVFLQEVRAARMPPNAEQVAIGLAEGKSQEEIASELGVTEGSVHRTTANLRKRFSARLAALGLLTTLLMLVVLLFVIPMGGVARPELAAPPATTAVAVTTQHAAAPEEPASLDGGVDGARRMRDLLELEAKPGQR